MNASDLVAITVTYHPDLVLLRTQLLALPEESLKILVDNTACAEVYQTLKDMAIAIPHTHLIENATNRGLAAALNQGVKSARQLLPTARWCLLLDQDSEPQPGSITTLFQALENLSRHGENVGGVGPALIDATTGLPHGFHQARKWRWRRIYPLPASTNPVSCTNLNGSGTLVSIDLFNEVGGMDESMFIDHVDTEWAFRLLSRGYSLWGIPNAVFLHRMGQSSLRYWLFGWKVWPHRSAQRHYYLFRNALWLMRRNYVSLVWKFWATVKLLLTLVVHLVLDPNRREQINYMMSGLRDGLIRKK